MAFACGCIVLGFFGLAIFGFNNNVNGLILDEGGTCNATFSENSFCINRESFEVNTNGICKASTEQENCWFTVECICNGNFSGFNLVGWDDLDCSVGRNDVWYMPVDTCWRDHAACAPSNDTGDGGYAHLDTDQFKLCCPECKDKC
eukprot:238492_1